MPGIEPGPQQPLAVDCNKPCFPAAFELFQNATNFINLIYFIRFQSVTYKPGDTHSTRRVICCPDGSELARQVMDFYNNCRHGELPWGCQSQYVKSVSRATD